MPKARSFAAGCAPWIRFQAVPIGVLAMGVLTGLDDRLIGPSQHLDTLANSVHNGHKLADQKDVCHNEIDVTVQIRVL